MTDDIWSFFFLSFLFFGLILVPFPLLFANKQQDLLFFFLFFAKQHAQADNQSVRPSIIDNRDSDRSGEYLYKPGLTRQQLIALLAPHRVSSSPQAHRD